MREGFLQFRGNHSVAVDVDADNSDPDGVEEIE
jgi:hypothetical protein